jgi:protein-tyrosine-phosphatase
MAEGILNNLLQKRGIENIKVESAGTMAPTGCPPANYAFIASSENAIDISSHRSRLLTNEMVEEADLILVMEKAHKHFIEHQSDAARGKVFLLKAYGQGGKEKEIIDPIGWDLDVYRSCFSELMNEIQRIFNPIINKER